MTKTHLEFPLGATIDHDTVRFRVWAPNADTVQVVTDHTESDLTRLDDGTWAGTLEGGPGLEYLYRITNGTDTFDRLDPRGRVATNSVGRSVVPNPEFDWGDDAFVTPTVDHLVIYELHPGTFGEDFDGVTARIGHLAESGFNAIEIMPVAEFAGDLSWGYNPALPFAVESTYGGSEGLKRLVKAAHAAGFAFIVDVVYNHFGPSDLSMWRFDGWSDGDGGGIYFYNDNERAATPWGHTRPDYGRPEVRQYILDNARMWFEEYRVDGLRLDSTINIRTAGGAEGDGELADGWHLMQEISEMRAAEFPGRLLIAEDLQNNDWLTKTVGEGGAGFDIQWDARFVHNVRGILESVADEDRDVGLLAELVVGPHHRDGWGRVLYTESHDEVANGRTRVVSEIDPNDPVAWFARGRALCGLVAVLTARGVPMMFQGQEWLEADYFRDDQPVDWAAAEDDLADLADLRTLIQLRSGRDDGAHGLRGSGIEIVQLDEQARVLAYRRWRDGGPGDDVLVVINLGHDHRQVAYLPPAHGVWVRAVSTDRATTTWDLDDSPGVGADMAGYSALVFLAR